jgi:hypothetical protein
MWLVEEVSNLALIFFDCENLDFSILMRDTLPWLLCSHTCSLKMKDCFSYNGWIF